MEELENTKEKCECCGKLYEHTGNLVYGCRLTTCSDKCQKEMEAEFRGDI